MTHSLDFAWPWSLWWTSYIKQAPGGGGLPVPDTPGIRVGRSIVTVATTYCKYLNHQAGIHLS